MNAAGVPHVNSPRFAGWLRIFRAPNLLTVSGDPLAGFLLARGAFPPADAKLLLAMIGSLAFYGAGLLMNDLVDLETDRRERPARPLPSGVVAPARAFAACVLLLVVGVTSVALIGPLACGVAAALILTITSYNLLLKGICCLGPLAMGLCRGLSLFLGVSAAGGPPFPIATLTAAALVMFYVAAATVVARNETRPGHVGPARWLPALALLVGAIPFLQSVRWGTTFMIALLFVAWVIAARAGQRLGDGDACVPLAIGLWIGLLLWLQASFALGAGAVNVAVLLLALWPVNRVLAKRFEAS